MDPYIEEVTAAAHRLRDLLDRAELDLARRDGVPVNVVRRRLGDNGGPEGYGREDGD